MLHELTALCLASRPVEPASFWTAWSLAPATMLPLVATLACFLAWRRRGTGRAWPFAAGWALLAAALASPLCRLAATTASGHMGQHVLLVVGAPVLLALALPGLSPRVNRPAVASAAFAAAVWLSHAPSIYQATLLNGAMHLIQIALLLGASLLFWRALIAAPPGTALAMAFTALLHTGMLGALLTFASRPWYPVFGAGPAMWGLTPLEDQQLAGLIMWVPMGGAFLFAALGILATSVLRQAPVAAPRRSP